MKVRVCACHDKNGASESSQYPLLQSWESNAKPHYLKRYTKKGEYQYCTLARASYVRTCCVSDFAVFFTFFGGRKSWRDAIGELLFFSVFIRYYRNRFVASVIWKSTSGIFFFSHSSNYYLRCSLYASEVLACSDITILCTISISWGLAIQFLGLADEMIRIQRTICEITTFYLPVKPTNIASNKQIFVSNKTYVLIYSANENNLFLDEKIKGQRSTNENTRFNTNC